MSLENQQIPFGVFCASITSRHKKLCTTLAVVVLLLCMLGPVTHIMLLLSCGGAQTRYTVGCGLAFAFSFGRGVIVPATLLAGEIAVAGVIGLWCTRNVCR